MWYCFSTYKDRSAQVRGFAESSGVDAFASQIVMVILPPHGGIGTRVETV